MPTNAKRITSPRGGRTQVEQITLEQFSRRLGQAMVDAGLSQSELAAKIWGRTTDNRGYSVAKGRDRISIYLKGMALPDHVNMQKLAEALGLTVEELAPDLTAQSIERDYPEIGITKASGHPDKILLRVNKIVPMEVAAKIFAILAEVKD